MLIVATYKKDARELANLTFTTTFGSLYKRLRLYFSTTNILNGEVISLPYISLMKDRRCKDIKVKDERRKPVKAII